MYFRLIFEDGQWPDIGMLQKICDKSMNRYDFAHFLPICTKFAT